MPASIARLRRFLPFLLLAALPCLLLWPVVFGGDVFLPADLLRDVAPWRAADPRSLVPWNPLQWDGMAEFYPWRLFAARTLCSGYLPLWNPHQFCGTPFAANSQSAVFYPLNLLFCLFPVVRAFGVSVLLHLFLTGSFMYLYLRLPSVALTRSAALLGAVAWQICHWQVAWLALPTFLCVSTWLPLALLLVDRAVERLSAARAASLGLCLGVLLLAGHLQIAFYCLGLIAAYALFRVLPILRSQSKGLLRTAVLTSAIAFGLAAPQLLPAVELARMSHRAGGAVDWSAYAGYVRLAVPPVNLLTLFAPGFFGSPTRGTYWGVGLNGGPGAYMENACYGGVLTLLLAVVGIMAAWRTHAETRFFGAAAVVALLLALGSPLNTLLFFGVPGWAQTGSPGRVLVLWSFCLPVLAAFGADSLLRRLNWRTLRSAALIFGAAALGTAIYAAVWIDRTAPPGTLTGNLSLESDLWRLPAGVLLAAAAALWLHQRGSLPASILGSTWVLLTALDLLAAGYGFNRTAPPPAVYPVTPLIAFLQAHTAEGRIMPLNKQWSFYGPPPAILPPNSATVYGLDDTQGYDSLLTGRYFQFAGALDGGSPAPPENGNLVFTNGFGSPKAREAGACYGISRTPLPGLVPVFQGDGAFVYEDKEALPRVQASSGTVTVLDSPPSRVAVVLPSDLAARQITVADQWYPGWVATYARRPVSLRQGSDVFRTVTLSAGPGNEVLEMRYEPTAFRVGLYALCLALGGAAAIAAAAGSARLDRNRFW